MRTRFVVLLHPNFEIGLQPVDGPINFLAERHAIELVEHGSMEALADSIRLRALGLGAGVIDVLDGEIELVVVMLGVAAILGAAILSTRHSTMPCSSKNGSTRSFRISAAAIGVTCTPGIISAPPLLPPKTK